MWILLVSTLLLSGCLSINQKPAPVALYGRGEGAGSLGIHTVTDGETIYSISKRYNMVMRDIVMENHLSAPFALKAGQRIKLPPPRTYRAREGDTLYDISRLFGVSSTDLASLNKLSAPYRVHGGQMLRLPSVSPPRSEDVQMARSDLPAFVRFSRIQSEVLPAPADNRVDKRVDKKAEKTNSEEPQAKKESSALETAHVLEAPHTRPREETAMPELPKRVSGRFMRPVNGKILSSYGGKTGGLHNDGINIAAAKGTSVQGAENGVVVYAGSELKGSGNLVLIRHEDRWMSAYAHMDTIKVKRGDVIKRGQAIGTVGSTGSVDSPQLHFELRRGTEAINPARYLEGMS